MEEGIAILRKYKDFLQNLHWITAKDYARHILYERLMNDIPELLDRYVEVFMGSRGLPLNVDEIKTDINEADIRDFVIEAKQKFSIFLISAKESEMNVLGDILEMFDRHLYLL